VASLFGRKVVAYKLNNSGGSVAKGDVLVPDTSANNAFTTTTSAAVTTGVWIADETIASAATGRVVLSGHVELVNVSASVTRGHTGTTHTVAKQAVSTGGTTRTTGTFCKFTTGGTTPEADIWPVDLLGSSLTNPMDGTGQLIYGGAAGAPTKLAAGAQGTVLKMGATNPGWTQGLTHSRRIIGQDLGNADATFNVNSSSYVGLASAQFYFDWDVFPATHFLITAYGHSNESGQTVTLQYATQASPGTGYSASGNDLAITFNGGANTNFSSGWVAVSGTPTGLVYVTLAFKGSNTTVDLVGRWIDIAFKIV
jgi:hypothetical protein